MTSIDQARNLYLEHVVEDTTQARLDAWTTAVETEPEGPPFRWHMRVDNYIRHTAIGASARIEGNPLTLSQADELLGGGSVDAPADAVREITNYRDTQDLASTFAQDPDFSWSEMIARTINSGVMRGLDGDSHGVYRTEPVGVGDVYQAPDHRSVPSLMNELMAWLRDTDQHPLLRAAMLHLNLVAVHPWIDGNGRSARIMSSLELMRVVRAPELISIETSLLDSQERYFRGIREALGPSYNPETHSTTEWVAWYVDLHAQRLESGIRLREAVKYDIGTVVSALETSGDPLDWGPILELASFGRKVHTRDVATAYSKSLAVARSKLSKVEKAGWIESHGRTSGTYYVGTDRVRRLHLRAPELLARDDETNQEA